MIQTWLQCRKHFRYVLAADVRKRLLVGRFHARSHNQSMAVLAMKKKGSYGTLKSMSMDSAMLYNLPVLYGLYGVIAGFGCVMSQPYPLISAIGFGSLWSDIGMSSLLILSLVANSIHQLLLCILTFCHSRSTISVRFCALSFVGSVFVCLLVGLGIALWWVGYWDFNHMACSCYVAGIACLYISSFLLVKYGGTTLESRQDNAAFAAMIMLLLPAIFTGKVVLMIWEQKVDNSSWPVLLFLLAVVPLTCLLKLTSQYATLRLWRRWRCLTLVVSLMPICYSILRRGNAFRLFHLAFVATCSEGAMEIVARVVSLSRNRRVMGQK